MQTSKWGPSAWDTFFIFSRNYPEKLDLALLEHRKIRKATISFYSSLDFLLPCKYCRDSYQVFRKELDLEKYLSGRDQLTYWLYLLKDKVNKKLISQEKTRFKEEIQVLKDCKKYTKEKEMRLRKMIFKTVSSPPFPKVLAHYESFRARCSDKTKTCKK